VTKSGFCFSTATELNQPARAFIRCPLKRALTYSFAIVVLLLAGYGQYDRGLAPMSISKSRTIFSQSGTMAPAHPLDIIIQESSVEEEEEGASVKLTFPSWNFPHSGIVVSGRRSGNGSCRNQFLSHTASHDPRIGFRVFRI
jgi:hypothetical protein